MNKFVLLQDDSSHWYCVPIEKEAEFEQWLDDVENLRAIRSKYDEYRLTMHLSSYSFENFELRP